MIFTLSTNRRPATDLGYLLHKNPARVHEFSLNCGKAHVFYPHATEEQCTAALMVTVDPVSLVRGKRKNDAGWSLGQYVNDRPYAASSFLSTAIADVFGTAMNGRCKDKPELVDQPFPLTITVPVLPSSPGEDGIRRLFEPLGYRVLIEPHPLDEKFPAWGESRYFAVLLEIEQTVQLVLQQLYVLVPALDNNKHYFVAKDEVDKLLAKGGEWLAAHPEKEWITRRYLKFQRRLADEALERLEALDAETAIEENQESAPEPEAQLEERINLHQQRLGTVIATLKKQQVRSVADLGCGEGKLLRMLMDQTAIPRIIGMDVSSRSLEIAKERLRLDRMPPMKRQRLELILGSLLYRDKRLEGVDAAVLVEVIEHLDPPRLEAMERIVFEASYPRYVIVTTPNAEFNVTFENLPAGKLRHSDHRFEWTRAEFQHWADTIAERFGYTYEHSLIGPEKESVGAASQMAIFTRKEEA